MKTRIDLVTERDALPGRSEPLVVERAHLALGTPMMMPSDPDETAYFGLGCFWGAERIFWQRQGVRHTAVGYQGGYTPNPTYREVCSGLTGHSEVVKVIFDPTVVTYAELVALFFEQHDPTQGMRQGADVGTQYRSAIYTTSDLQAAEAAQVRDVYAERLRVAGFGAITTEIAPAGPFYLAEEYHQQYLIANPDGYCGIGGTGVSCPVGLLGS
jgi:peptide-methionine (S)-S-oxide reductase